MITSIFSGYFGSPFFKQFSYDSNSNDNLIKQSNGLKFLYDHTGLFAVKYNSSTYYYRKDLQTNIISLLDNTGAVVVVYKHDAWGNSKLGWANNYHYIRCVMKFGGTIYNLGGPTTGSYGKELALIAKYGYKLLVNLF